MIYQKQYPSRHTHHFWESLYHALLLIGGWIRKNAVLSIAFVAAVATSCMVPPDTAYLSYFDFKTLTCLFCVLAVVCALKNIRFFTILARKIVDCTGNLRMASIALVYITFIGSMLIANDMALLTFLPLGFFVLSSTGKEKYMAFVFIMQNIAANLGGMLTPFGNPQNLYLYTKFAIPTGEFMRIMLLPFLASIALITVCCLFLPKDTLSIREECPYKLKPKRTILYLILFALSIIIVFRVIPYQIGLIVIPLVLFFVDRQALRAVDYPLLLTFVCFFIFAGNMARIPAVSHLFSSLLEKNTLVFSVLSCQVISNVPSAILLSQFTTDYQSLLLGVNIGGTGTLIASLASLITFRQYTEHNPGKAGKYILLFSAFNFGFMILLTVLASFLIR
ncbi:MAG: citrate transporter [Ruminococcaceae bacterium]|nr:citrate transporter [Oscillospiraceae bacterium]